MSLQLLSQASKHSFGAEQYWEWARIFSRLAHTDIDNGLSDLIVPFLDIGKEGELQGQIKSVIRDLEIMIMLTTDQRDIAKRFAKALGSIAGVPHPADIEPIHAEIKNTMVDLEAMRKSAGDISTSVGARNVLQAGHDNPLNHYQLDYLISLKQQQVTVVQAWQSMKQGEDNQKQNVTLLVFTVVTVIFVSWRLVSLRNTVSNL